jgi:HEAT repeat protein
MLTVHKLSRAIALTAAVIITAATFARAADAIKASPEKEKELLAVLRSDAPPAEKAITCKRLAIDGSSAAVPELAKLLSSPELASWARIALEAIPGPEADEALRKAAQSLEGRLLVGTINSIGVRRDGKAVESLSARLQDKDPEVAAAAAVALGHIGGPAAAKSLTRALAIDPVQVRSAAAEGCVLCAEGLLAAGKSDQAVELYEQVRRADLPKQRKIEATRGAILARKDQGIPLLLEQFRSADYEFFQLALFTAREYPGAEVDKAIADELNHATPDRAAMIIRAMADRPKTVVVSAVVKAAEQGPKLVRIPAIEALGRVGDASSLGVLLATALDADPDLAKAAKASLAELPGEKVDAQLVALLPKAEGKQYELLVELAGQRRLEATPDLVRGLDHADKAVRAAALAALGETVRQSDLSVLISQVVSPKHADDAAAATTALKTASVRMPDREACAAELASAIDRTQELPTKISLLDIVAAVGGKNALTSVATAAGSKEDKLQDVGTRLLGNWTTQDAAPVLLQLAKDGTGEKYQTRALRGYLRIARQFVLSDSERMEMCRKAFDVARQPAEQKLVLDVLKRIPSQDALNMAIKGISVPELKNEASAATLVIAQKLAAKGVDVSEAVAKAGFEKVKLEIVKAEYGSAVNRKDVTSMVRKHAGEYPLISLPAASYNSAFGGDPTPGSPKQLKIQYRINDKPGEATFSEDSLLILPMPE